jgi:hypothetical protein
MKGMYRIALALALLVGLAACTGSNDGLSKSQEQALEAERDAALQAEMEAQAAQEAAERAAAEAQAALEAAQARVTELENQPTIAELEMAVSDAQAALAEANDARTMAMDALTAAENAVTAALAAVASATDATIDDALAALQMRRDEEAAAAAAVASADSVVMARTATLSAAQAALAAADPSRAALEEARQQLLTAQEARKAAEDELAARQKAREDQEAAEKAEEEMKARVATAKAFKAAIDAPRSATTSDADPVVITPTSIPSFDPDGDTSDTSDSTAALTLKKGDAVAALGNWKGTDYTGMTGSGTTKTTGMVRVYSNEEAAKSVSFISEGGMAIHGLMLETATSVTGDYTVPLANAAHTESAVFPSSGTTTYTGDDRKFAGTYRGAPGTYECTDATDCTATADGISGGEWTFTPSAGAMLQEKDESYLQFGWWYRKDKDGPTHAGGFYGVGGTTTLTAVDTTNTATLTGEATYTGKAVGKFAISDPLRPASDDSGHFTADAELVADFKGAGSDLSGTIDNFRLNDGSADPGWSVELKKNPTAVTNGAFGNATNGTVWSIGDVSSAADGEWEARMYDDKESDGNNTPQYVLGSFMSSISTTHSMAGAFGAER